jgi:hypothetical protein
MVGDEDGEYDGGDGYLDSGLSVDAVSSAVFGSDIPPPAKTTKRNNKQASLSPGKKVHAQSKIDNPPDSHSDEEGTTIFDREELKNSNVEEQLGNNSSHWEQQQRNAAAWSLQLPPPPSAVFFTPLQGLTTTSSSTSTATSLRPGSGKGSGKGSLSSSFVPSSKASASSTSSQPTNSLIGLLAPPASLFVASSTSATTSATTSSTSTSISSSKTATAAGGSQSRQQHANQASKLPVTGITQDTLLLTDNGLQDVDRLLIEGGGRGGGGGGGRERGSGTGTFSNNSPYLLEVQYQGIAGRAGILGVVTSAVEREAVFYYLGSSLTGGMVVNVSL